jgi:hypothetical protein
VGRYRMGEGYVNSFNKHVMRKGGDKRGSGDHVGWEMIFSNCVDRSGGGS